MPDLCIRQIRKGIPDARDDAGKQWQEVSTQSVQTDEAKGDVRSLGSQGILSNGNGTRYLQKSRKEEEGTKGTYISEHLQKGTYYQHYRLTISYA